jgi:hypothetical protein
MSNTYAMTQTENELQQVSCTRRDLDILGGEIRGRRWHADLLDDEGDYCGRMMLAVDSAAPYGSGFRWSCQLGVYFGSGKWDSGPMACGIGDTPQAAYDAALEYFDRRGCTIQAAYFRGVNK